MSAIDGPKFLRWRDPVMVVLLALVLALLATGWRLASTRRVVLALTELQAAREPQPSAGASLAANSDSEHGRVVARFIGVASNRDVVLKEVRRSASGLGVAVPAVAFVEMQRTEQSLAHVDMTLTLNGSYANVKAVLAEALDRHPSLVLHRMSIRKTSPSPSDVQAQVGLRLASLPETAGVAGR